MLSYGHLTERKRHAVSMQADTRAIVWLRVDDPGASAKHIVVDPCGTEKYIKAQWILIERRIRPAWRKREFSGSLGRLFDTGQHMTQASRFLTASLPASLANLANLATDSISPLTTCSFGVSFLTAAHFPFLMKCQFSVFLAPLTLS